jgi:membrane protein YqaA with SNARE-associated domain
LVPFFYVLVFLFAISLVANATPFFGAAYTVIATTELVAIGFNLESFALVVSVTALGATLGKIVLYAGARGLRQPLQKNKNVKLMGRWLGKTGFYVTLFVTALIPILPLDDYVYIGAGANSARLAPMLGVTFLAKFTKSAFEILLEFSGILGFSTFTFRYLGLSRLDVSIILSAILLILGVVIYKIDWQRWIDAARRLFGFKTNTLTPY